MNRTRRSAAETRELRARRSRGFHANRTSADMEAADRLLAAYDRIRAVLKRATPSRRSQIASLAVTALTQIADAADEQYVRGQR